MLEIKEATKVNAFSIEGRSGLFKKITKVEALTMQDKAERALFGSTISWFIPFESDDNDD